MNSPRARIVNKRADQIRRQQVGRELQALEPGLDRGGHRFDRERLGEAGHAFEKNVAIGEQTEQKPIDQIFLSDDDMSNLLAQRRNPAAEFLDLLRNFLRRSHRFFETRNVPLRSNKATAFFAFVTRAGGRANQRKSATMFPIRRDALSVQQLIETQDW